VWCRQTLHTPPNAYLKQLCEKHQSLEIFQAHDVVGVLPFPAHGVQHQYVVSLEVVRLIIEVDQIPMVQTLRESDDSVVILLVTQIVRVCLTSRNIPLHTFQQLDLRATYR
jgi:hypothetical protein